MTIVTLRIRTRPGRATCCAYVRRKREQRRAVLKAVGIPAGLMYVGLVGIWLLRAAGAGGNWVVFAGVFVYLAGILAVCWCAVRSTAFAWRSLDAGTLLAAAMFVPLTLLSEWELTSSSWSWWERAASSALVGGFLCGLVLLIAPRLADLTRNAERFWFGDLDADRRWWERGARLHRRNCLPYSDADRTRELRRIKTTCANRRRMRQSRRLREVQRWAQALIFRPYSEPAAWVNTAVAGTTLLILLQAQSVPGPWALLALLPFAAYPCLSGLANGVWRLNG